MKVHILFLLSAAGAFLAACNGRPLSPASVCQREPTPGNLVVNADLDHSAEGFALYDLAAPPGHPAEWAEDDARGCDASGSVVTQLKGQISMPVVTQVFPLKQGASYFAGLRLKQDPVEDVGFRAPCNIQWCTSETCGCVENACHGVISASDFLLPETSDASSDRWVRVDGVVTPPPGATHARMICGSAGVGYFDRFYVSEKEPSDRPAGSANAILPPPPSR